MRFGIDIVIALPIYWRNNQSRKFSRKVVVRMRHDPKPADRPVTDSAPTQARPESDGARGVYGISVAAELVGVGVQTLRLYEARGLLEPERTDGRTRRYSTNDLDQLRHIGELLTAGVNLAGIARILELETQLAEVLHELHTKTPRDELMLTRTEFVPILDYDQVM